MYPGGRSLPPPGAITMVEVNLKRTFSSRELEKGTAIKDNVIIVEKGGIWPNFVVWVRLPAGSVVEGWGGGGGGGGHQEYVPF